MNLYAALVTLLDATVEKDGDITVRTARKRVAQKVASLAPVFEPKPRADSAPLICIHENLPAFETEWDLNVFATRRVCQPIVEKWQCEKCGWWHAVFEPRRKKA